MGNKHPSYRDSLVCTGMSMFRSLVSTRGGRGRQALTPHIHSKGRAPVAIPPSPPPNAAYRQTARPVDLGAEVVVEEGHWEHGGGARLEVCLNVHTPPGMQDKHH